MKSISHHLPQRTCVACRKIGAKRELLRLVRISDGSVAVDAGVRQAGRGAYLCRVWDCWESGLKGGRLEHALRTAITQDNREQLIKHGEDLLSRG